MGRRPAWLTQLVAAEPRTKHGIGTGLCFLLAFAVYLQKDRLFALRAQEVLQGAGLAFQTVAEPESAVFRPAAAATATDATRSAAQLDTAFFGGSVWLYTCVATSYGGERLLPHFMKHYSALGIPVSNFIILLNHNADVYHGNRTGLEECEAHLQQHSVNYTVWEGQYSQARHHARKLALLQARVNNPNDWVLAMDADEFLKLETPNIREVLDQAEAEGATWIAGQLVERLAPNAGLRPVNATPAISQQFPVECTLQKKLVGSGHRAVAFKAFLRQHAAGTMVVAPGHAQWYFEGCANDTHLRVPSPHLTKDCRGWWLESGGEKIKKQNLYPLTPYSTLRHRYLIRGVTNGSWTDKAASFRLDVRHYKWHKGLLANLRDRAAWYRGSCNPAVPDKQQKQCQPRYSHWRQPQHMYDLLKESNRIPDSAVTCDEDTFNYHRPASLQ